MAENFSGVSRTNYGSMGNAADVLPDVGFTGDLVMIPEEIFYLNEKVSTNIYLINSGWKVLEQALKVINTGRDNQELRDKIHETQLNCNELVTETTRHLQTLSLIVRKENKQLKLQTEKLASDFKEAVQCYSDYQKKVADQMKAGVLKGFVFKSPSINDDEEMALIQEHQQIAAQQILQQQLDFEQGLLIEREYQIQGIEADILDINQIMREVGAMVHEQGEAVNSIENNIENVHGNVELGQEELAKAAEYQNKFRRKLCFLVAIALVVGIVLAVILITQLKS